jgi:hypothetical protein
LEKDLLFLEKKKQKDFSIIILLTTPRSDIVIKLFWFFFFEKEPLPSHVLIPLHRPPVGTALRVNLQRPARGCCVWLRT